ncbi:MAG: bifunctional (p)ppGpp synthetase/guanosine-3',5'-bis(diphosphate) 3'-pyrophosphohydrolase [Lachnospiraceae bacterium]|nr:bifunctional (p)ppGpp synthetase/guanosine-3',5'-bis(diphosphate) 3'-pyrophosphohydrolase [Candidatus Merdinaster equi]
MSEREDFVRVGKVSLEGHDTTDEKNELVIDDGRIEATKEFASPEELYQDLLVRVRKYHPSDDISIIEKAYHFAYEAHKEQKRKSGEPYIIHPLCVAIALAELEMDKETIVAGLLHDVVEDTKYTDEEIEQEFGSDVALLVEGVTKLDKMKYKGGTGDKADLQADNLRKMFLAMAKDIRVVIIKLADRLHNMRTLDYQSPAKQQEISRETLDIYSPIAQRLGISRVKVELDDLSLRYLEPEVYADLVDKIAIRRTAREKYIQTIVDEVSEHIRKAEIKAQIDGRVKHFFSIYKKMKNQNKTIDQIYDLFAVRIIVDSVRDCYAALGVIHEMYKPIPGRFKDYIAMPKGNMYQSLHTTLIGKNGVPFEIQIRTLEMHKAAEYGIAAHWKYKTASDGKKVDEAEQEKLNWLKQILEWQKDESDNKEFMNLLKSDLNLFADNVYCFTPSGDVKNLPAGSTPIDFAYAIHTAVGNKMVGARVNGQLVPIDYELKNGDQVDIITSQNSKGPSMDWLNICKSTPAKNKINQWFKSEQRDDNILRGKEAFMAYCKAKGIMSSHIMKPEYMEKILHRYGFVDWDSVLAAIGHGALKEGQIANRMMEFAEADRIRHMSDSEALEEIKETAQQKAQEEAVKMKSSSSSKSAIVVKGIHDVAVRFSKCCSPVPGDEIVGFVTRGRGVSIHRTDCVNILSMAEFDRVRLIDAEWQEDSESGHQKYLADIRIVANNRTGLLVDITKILSEKNIDIRSVNTRTSKAEKATMDISLAIGSRAELGKIIDKLRSVESVIAVERTSS